MEKEVFSIQTSTLSRDAALEWAQVSSHKEPT